MSHALTQLARLLTRMRELRGWSPEELAQQAETERFTEAEALLGEVSRLADRVGRDWERLQARWMSGWIAAGSGRTEDALRILRLVRQELLAAGRLVEAAGVALDLAALQSGTEEVAELRRELEPLIEEKSLTRDARMAVKVFCWAVDRGRLDVPMGRRLAAELRRGGGRLMRPYEIPV